MIAFRAMQGFVGGAMVPTVFAVGFTIFEGKQRALIPAILGMVSVLAPTIGPTVGGIITDTPRLALDLLHQHRAGRARHLAVDRPVIDVDRANPSMFGRIDWSHLVAMAVVRWAGWNTCWRRGRGRTGSAIRRS